MQRILGGRAPPARSGRRAVPSLTDRWRGRRSDWPAPGARAPRRRVSGAASTRQLRRRVQALRGGRQGLSGFLHGAGEGWGQAEPQGFALLHPHSADRRPRLLPLLPEEAVSECAGVPTVL